MTATNDFDILGTGGLGSGGGGGSGDATSLQGVPISPNAPNTGEILTYNGSAWIPLPGTDVPLTGPLLQEVRNESGAQIVRGSPVYINSAAEGLPLIELASSTTFDTSRMIGLVSANINDDDTGTVVKSGIAVADTSAFIEGDILYLGETDGTFTDVRPMGAQYPVVLGIVTSVGVTGELVVLIDQSQYTAETVTPLGWRDNSIINIDVSFIGGVTRTMTVVHNTESSFIFYEAGIKYTVPNGDANAEIQISDVEGLHVVFYDEGVITTEANPTRGRQATLIRTKPLVGYVTWNATDNVAVYLAQETHQFKLDAFSHALWHFNVGATWQGGYSLGNFTIGSGSADVDAQFSVESGILSDEDLVWVTIPYGVSEGVDVFYRVGALGEWRRDSAAGFSVKSFVGGGGRLAYNEFTGGAWQQTEATSGRYLLAHIYATNDILGKGLFAIQGQAEYTTAADAREGAVTELSTLSLGNILVEEYFPVATVIYQTSNVYANTILARIIPVSAGVNYVNWLTETLGPGATPSSHLNLTDINGGAEGDGGHTVLTKLAGRAGGQTLVGSTLVSEDLTLTDNAVDLNSITLTELIAKVDGPISATDNALARFDLTTGKVLQNSAAVVDDSGNFSTSGTVQGRDMSTDGTKLDNIEALADVTDADNVAAAGAIMETIADAAGDLILANGNDSVARLPIGSEGEVLTIDTGAVAWGTAAGGGDVVGPISATDEALARFDLTTGKLLQNGPATVDDSGNLATTGTVQGRDMSADGTKLDNIEALADVTDADNVATAGAEFIANKDAVSGYAGLDGSSKIEGAQQTYGAIADTACEGDDLRLSNSRTPTVHALDGAAHSGTLDHTAALTNVGTTTHANIDSHIAAANPHSGSMGDDLIDAAGDVIYGTAADTPAVLPIGSTGQALLVSAGGLPTWGTPAGGGDVTGPGSSTDNAIALYNGVNGDTIKNSAATIDGSGNLATTGTVQGRDMGVDGTKLDNIEALADVTDADNVATAGAIMETIADAAGDLILADGNDSVARLGIGSDGQVLKVDTGSVVWGTAAGGGDVSGPGSSTDSAIALYNGVNGDTIKNSAATIDGSGNLATTGTVQGRDMSADGTKLDNIEALADVTDADNVASAGAIMETIADAAGDLILADGNDSVVRLPAGSEGQVLEINGGAVAWGAVSGTGDVVGPPSATNEALARFDLTTGKLLQNGPATVDDSGNLATTGTVQGRDMSADGTKLDGIEALADVTDVDNITSAGAELIANKDAVSGYAGLDGSSKIDGAQQTYGAIADTACEGDDLRLTNSRTPTVHALNGAAHSGTLDHITALTNVGTNTHAQVDTHIAAANPHSGSLGNVVEDTTPQLGGDLDLNQHSIELDPTPTTDETFNGLILGGVTVDVNTQGFANAMHLDTDGNWVDAQADAATSMPCQALAVETGTGTHDVLLKGVVRDDSWTWTVGGPIYVSDATAGALIQTAPTGSGDLVQIAGYALSADVMLFDPDKTFLELT